MTSRGPSKFLTDKKWAELKKIEPRLGDLESELREVRDNGEDESFCANRIWYAPGGPKSRLINLVGAEAEKVELEGNYLYEEVYDYLSHLLPDCRDCGCG
jgi:hypothetical protein